MSRSELLACINVPAVMERHGIQLSYGRIRGMTEAELGKRLHNPLDHEDLAMINPNIACARCGERPSCGQYSRGTRSVLTWHKP